MTLNLNELEAAVARLPAGSLSGADPMDACAILNAAPALIAAARERDELAGLLRECMAVLAQIEYADNSGHEYRAKCPACHQASTERHAKDCTLHGTFKRIDAALAKVGP